MGKLFGTDGIRGIANEYPMTAEMVLLVGRAAAHICKKGNHRHRIVIGKDTRLSGYMLENALVAGICSMGVDALIVGPMPTPGIAFLTTNMKADAGIVLSASHNPFQDNGIKIFSRNGYKLPDSVEEEIEQHIFSKNIDSLRYTAEEVGKAFRIEDAIGRYIVFLKNSFPKKYTLDGLKIVVDCANGATYKVAPTILYELGADVISINTKPDGQNINRDSGAMHPQCLADAVIDNKADIGLAFDGDGDRLIAVDEKGRIITGDQILAIFTHMLKKQNRLKNNVMVSTVMSNLGLSLMLKEMGVKHIKAKVGDRYVIEEMLKHGAILGGEDSGHIIFKEFHTTGDGIISALALLAAVLAFDKPLSTLAKFMKVYPQCVINIDVKSKPDLSTVPSITKAIADSEKSLGSKGRVLVRYSGTQSICRVMVEGPTEDKTTKLARQIAEVVKLRLA